MNEKGEICRLARDSSVEHRLGGGGMNVFLNTSTVGSESCSVIISGFLCSRLLSDRAAAKEPMD